MANGDCMGGGLPWADLPTCSPRPLLQRCFQTTNGYLSGSRSCSSNYNVAALATSSLVGRCQLPSPVPGICTFHPRHQLCVGGGRILAPQAARAGCRREWWPGVPAPMGEIVGASVCLVRAPHLSAADEVCLSGRLGPFPGSRARGGFTEGFPQGPPVGVRVVGTGQRWSLLESRGPETSS